MPAGILVLEDGTIYQGDSFGATGRSFGEIVFNTGMTGYQEVLTDPSYAGQIVNMTYPLIGNYGLNKDDNQSRRPWVRGFIAREACDEPSNWRAAQGLSSFLAHYGIIGLAGVDTRALTRRIRTYGTMRALLSTRTEDQANVPALIRELQEMSLDGPALVPEVTTPEPYHLPGSGPLVVVVDLGVKFSLLRRLQSYNLDLVVVPCHASLEEILALEPAGVLLSSGPGDPKDVPGTISVARDLVQRLPVFGICLGHQIIGLALGGDTFKLKFGHRGANHPVKDLVTGRVYITSQNHGYALAEEGLPPALEVTHRNLNDGTVEGIRHRELPVLGVQYHPEAGPGPEENYYLFEKFLSFIGNSN